MLIPSIVIEPPHISTIRVNAIPTLDFPAAVRPQMPTFSPALISKSRPFMTLSKFGLYFNYTFLKQTCP